MSGATLKCRFLVIGGGIAGAGAAAAISQHGPTVIAEMEDIAGYHTTGRSAAFFSEAYGNETIRKFNVLSRKLLEDPPASFHDSSFLSPRGALFIAKEEQTPRLKTYVEDASRFVHLEEISGEAARAICQVLNSDIKAAVFEPGASEIDVAGLHHAYLRTAKKYGASLVLSSPAMRFERMSTGWRVAAGVHNIEADVIINAAGAWGDLVAQSAGIKPVGLKPLRRTAAVFDAPDDLTIDSWPLIIDADEQFYFKPEGGGILASPGNEDPTEPGDEQPDILDIAILADRLQTATTLKVKRIRTKWAGQRTFVGDRSPVLGPDPDDDAFIWCCGQGGYGIQTSPAISQLVGMLATNGEAPPEFAALGLRLEEVSPARFRTAQNVKPLTATNS